MRRALATTILAGTFLAAGAAMASEGGGGDGGSGYGESYYNDMQRNPRLIEPGADRERYLSYYGREGWDQRQAAARGPGSPPYGNVTVRPYGLPR